MAYRSIFNGSTNTVEIEFIRDGELVSKTISRYYFNDFMYSLDEPTEN